MAKRRSDLVITATAVAAGAAVLAGAGHTNAQAAELDSQPVEPATEETVQAEPTEAEQIDSAKQASDAAAEKQTEAENTAKQAETAKEAAKAEADQAAKEAADAKTQADTAKNDVQSTIDKAKSDAAAEAQAKSDAAQQAEQKAADAQKAAQDAQTKEDAAKQTYEQTKDATPDAGALDQAESDLNQAKSSEQAAQQDVNNADKAAQDASAEKTATDQKVTDTKAAENQAKTAEDAAKQTADQADATAKDAQTSYDNAKSAYDDAVAYQEGTKNVNDTAAGKAAVAAETEASQAEAEAQTADNQAKDAESMAANAQKTAEADQKTADGMNPDTGETGKNLQDATGKAAAAEEDKNVKDQAVKDAEDALNKAKTQKDAADKAYSAVQSDAAAQQAVTDANKALADANATVADIQDKLNKADEQYKQGMWGFLNWIISSDKTSETLKQDAQNALKILNMKSFDNGLNKDISLVRNDELDATSITNIKKELQSLEDLNAIRTGKGIVHSKDGDFEPGVDVNFGDVGEAYVNLSQMAIGMSDADNNVMNSSDFASAEYKSMTQAEKTAFRDNLQKHQYHFNEDETSSLCWADDPISVYWYGEYNLYTNAAAKLFYSRVKGVEAPDTDTAVAFYKANANNPVYKNVKQYVANHVETNDDQGNWHTVGHYTGLFASGVFGIGQKADDGYTYRDEDAQTTVASALATGYNEHLDSCKNKMTVSELESLFNQYLATIDKDSLSNALKTAQADVKEKTTALDNAKAALNDLSTSRTTAQKNKDDADAAAKTATDNLTKVKKDADAAAKAYTQAMTAKDKAQAAYDQATKEYNDALKKATASAKTASDLKTAAESARQHATDLQNEAEAKRQTATQKRAEANAEINAAVAPLKEKLDQADAALKSANDAKTKADADYQYAKEKTVQATEAYNDAVQKAADAKVKADKANKDLADAKDQLAKAQNAVATAQEKYDNLVAANSSLKEAADVYEQAKTATQAAKKDLDEAQDVATTARAEADKATETAQIANSLDYDSIAANGLTDEQKNVGYTDIASKIDTVKSLQKDADAKEQVASEKAVAFTEAENTEKALQEAYAKAVEAAKSAYSSYYSLLPDYSIVIGADADWTKGDDADLEIASDGNFDYFEGITVDGVRVPHEDYTSFAGSTHVILKKSYLDGLSTGKHTLRFLYKYEDSNEGGSPVETTFTVGEKTVIPIHVDNDKIKDEIKNAVDNAVKKTEETANASSARAADLTVAGRNSADGQIKAVPDTSRSIYGGYTTSIFGMRRTLSRSYLHAGNTSKTASADKPTTAISNVSGHPKTGDKGIAGYISAIVASFAAMLTALFARKRKEQ